MKIHCLLAALITTISLSLSTTSLLAADVVPKLINYQGKLTDSAGAPLGGEDGAPFTLRFELFDAASDGTLIWGETRTVVVAGGIFNVALGGIGSTSVPGAAVNDIGFAFTGSERYLQTTIISGLGITSEQTLAPRQQMTSVPFAVQSRETDRAVVAALAESLIPELTNALNPPGAITAYGGAVVDNGGLIEPVPGYLMCNGAVVDEIAENGKYAALCAALSTNWGDGNDGDSNTIALPDLRGVFLRGWTGDASDSYIDPDRGGRVSRAPNGITGNNVGSFQLDQFKSHTHSYSRVSISPNNGVTYQGGFNNGSTASTGSAGGSETRGKNANVVFLIKY